MKSAFSTKDVKKRVQKATATVKAAEKTLDKSIKQGHEATKDVLCDCKTASKLPIVRKKIAQASAGIKATEKALQKGVKVAHEVTGDVLSRHEAGTKAVRKILGWEK